MQYALVDGQRTPPAPGLKGACSVCGASMLPKCGEKIIWHWAHAGRLHCDSWWERETEWHRAWKTCFPVSQREIVMFAPDGEKHVADVKTDNGMVIEFQNSPMKPEELRSREAFYGKMIWIVNAAPFASQFSIMSPVPSPNSALGKDLVFSAGQRPIPRLKPSPTAGLQFWRRSENPNRETMVRIHSGAEFHDEILSTYNGHHLFHWTRARDVWFESKAHVFLDFGDDVLWWLQVYDPEYDVRTIRRVVKADLVSKNGGNTSVLPGGGTSPFHSQIAAETLRPLWNR